MQNQPLSTVTKSRPPKRPIRIRITANICGTFPFIAAQSSKICGTPIRQQGPAVEIVDDNGKNNLRREPTPTVPKARIRRRGGSNEGSFGKNKTYREMTMTRPCRKIERYNYLALQKETECYKRRFDKRRHSYEILEHNCNENEKKKMIIVNKKLTKTNTRANVNIKSIHSSMCLRNERNHDGGVLGFRGTITARIELDQNQYQGLTEGTRSSMASMTT